MLPIERTDDTLRKLRLAILDNPTADAPRMAYADRLTEVGYAGVVGADVLAQFIQTQMTDPGRGCEWQTVTVTPPRGRRGLPQCACPWCLLLAFPGQGVTADPAPCEPAANVEVWAPDRVGWVPASMREERTAGRREYEVSRRPAVADWPSLVAVYDRWPGRPPLYWARAYPASGAVPVERRTVEWDRGFVATASCSTDDFVGRWCDACDGGGYVDEDRGSHGGVQSVSCTECAGDDRPYGGWAAVLARHPVTRVRLTDLPVSIGPGFNGYRYLRMQLPDALWRDVATAAGAVITQDWSVEFQSPQDATAALHHACLTYVARQRERLVRHGWLFDEYAPEI